MSFTDLGLHPGIVKAVTNAGYEEPTAIQAKAIPKVIKGFDLRASAQTGTGKTAAFLLPILNRLVKPQEGKGPHVLILSPTRELAQQIAVQAEKYSRNLPRCKTVCIGGGVPYAPQYRLLAKPCDILIATPGRLIDLIQQKKVSLKHVQVAVLDEADRMLDMGFSKPVQDILSLTPDTRQTLLFSATFDKEVMALSDKFLKNPMEIKVHAEKERHDHIAQSLHYVDNIGHKRRLLDHILETSGSTIIFTATKRHADELGRELRDKGERVASLHGDMKQRVRTRTVEQMRAGKIRILVATDVAARGIDINDISHVINFDLPSTVSDYVHRIGRTGRAGNTGTALSFASPKDRLLVKKIEEYTGHPFTVAEIPGFEPTKQRKAGKGKPNSFPRKEKFRSAGRKKFSRGR